MENNPRFFDSEFLKKSSDYADIKTRGQKIRISSYLIVYFATHNGPTQVGITVSGKVGNAVIRNKLKRWIRQYFRTQNRTQNLKLNLVFIVDPKINFKKLPYSEFEPVLHKMSKRLLEKNNG